MTDELRETDALRLRLASEKVRRADAELRAAKAAKAAAVKEAQQLQAEIIERYELSEGDEISLNEGQITRRDNGAAEVPATE